MKRRDIIVIFLILLTFNCLSQSSHRFIDNSIKVDSNNVPISNRQFYFPIKLFPEVEMVWEQTSKSSFNVTSKIIQNKVDSFHLIWYSKFLYAMQEPLLFNHQISKIVYRFTWLRTFHNPVMIRIEKDTSGINLYWKVTNGQGGYEPGNIMIDNKRKLTLLEWDKFVSMIDLSNFWKMQRGGSFGTDGSEWILEGVDPMRYYVISIWSPDKKSNFYKIGDFLMDLTDLKIKEEDKY